MKRTILLIITLLIILNYNLFASNIKIHTKVDNNSSKYSAYLVYLPNHIFSQYTAIYDNEYKQYRNQFIPLNSSTSIQIDSDELRNNDSDKLMNGSFVLMIDALCENKILKDQFFDVVVYTDQFYYIDKSKKVPTDIYVKVYDVQYKLITPNKDGGYKISSRTYIGKYNNRAVKHFYFGWTGKKNLIPGRYKTTFTFKIIDQT